MAMTLNALFDWNIVINPRHFET